MPQPELESAPSNVSSEASGLVDAPSADYSQADTDQELPRYAGGQKVLYDAFDQSVPVRGTVAKLQRSGAGPLHSFVMVLASVVSTKAISQLA